MKSNAWLLLLLSVTSVFAQTKTIDIKYEEGERLTASLSKLNFNRIVPEGEEIVRVSYPEHAFLVKTFDAEEEEDGSIYIKPLANIELTLYVTTNKKHHFSLTVTPDESEGSTFRVISKESRSYENIQKKQKEAYQTDDAMTELKEGRAPSGFRETKIIPSSFYHHKWLKMTLEKEYRSKESSAYVYRVENTSGAPIELDARLFHHTNLLSIDFSEQKLMPKESAFLYGFYRNNQPSV